MMVATAKHLADISAPLVLILLVLGYCVNSKYLAQKSLELRPKFGAFLEGKGCLFPHDIDVNRIFLYPIVPGWFHE